MNATALPDLLIVDDDEGTRTALRIGFARMGLNVGVAGNATEALDRLDEHEFGWALVDVRLPGMSGTELAGHIRRTRPATQVALMTAYDPPSPGEATSLGVRAVLEKPLNLGDIHRLLAEGV